MQEHSTLPTRLAWQMILAAMILLIGLPGISLLAVVAEGWSLTSALKLVAASLLAGGALLFLAIHRGGVSLGNVRGNGNLKEIGRSVLNALAFTGVLWLALFLMQC